MCHVSCIVFGATRLRREEVVQKTVIEIGSYNVNGSLRSVVESWGPSEYVGVDILPGRGVDVVCNAEDVVERFGKERFDLVISTELVEHTRNWRRVISDFKNVCKADGIILVTTRSRGFPFHPYPHDFWRYEIEDMRAIFSDCEVLSLEEDGMEPGVFVKAKKPAAFVENDLSGYRLYSIIANKRIAELTERDYRRASYILTVVAAKIRVVLALVGIFIESLVQRGVGAAGASRNA